MKKRKKKVFCNLQLLIAWTAALKEVQKAVVIKVGEEKKSVGGVIKKDV